MAAPLTLDTGGSLLSGERHVLELIATGADLPAVLDALCGVVDGQLGPRHISSVYLFDRDRKLLSFESGPRVSNEWRETTRIFPATPDAGACGLAVNRREQVIVADALASPLFQPWRRAAAESGIKAVWSTPFFSTEGDPLGTFAVLCREQGAPSDTQRTVVARATYLASIAVERHFTEKSLRESERRFSSAFYLNPACMTISRHGDGRLLYVNDAFTRMFGYSRAEAIGRTVLDLGLYADPADRPRLMRLLAENRLHDVEVRARTKTSDAIDVSLSMERIELLGEERVLGIAADITHRKRTEERLRRSEQLLAEAQRLAHIGSWYWDVPATTVIWSDEVYRIFGVQPGQIDPAREAMDFIDPADRDMVLAAVERTLKTREPYRFQYRIRRRDGEERILQSRGRVVTDDRNEPAAVFGSTQDITERERADAQLRAKEQLLRQVLDATPVGVTVTDRSGNVLLTNPAAKQIWGRVLDSGSERYAESKGWWHDTGARVAPDEWASIRAIRDGESSVNEVIDIEAFDHARKIIQNSAVPMRDASGAIIGAVIINEDISMRIAAERERDASLEQMRALTTRLMRTQEEERRRIAQMLHETTAQDLAGLKMLLGRLQRTPAALPQEERAALHESIELAERSMAGIRTLSYLLYPPFLDENGLLSALRWYAEGFAGRSGIEVQLDLPASLERLPRDVETTLFRVVQEALINVHRHSGSPTVDIALRAADSWLTLEIQDRGTGMPADFVARVTDGGGLGVGIAGMRERLAQLGGSMDIESGTGGTTVRVRVPTVPVPDA